MIRRKIECDEESLHFSHCSGLCVCVCWYSQCPHWSLPDLHRPCLMPKDCVVGEWAEWTPCSKTCADPDAPTGIRTRSRVIQQLPVGGGSQCLQLEEQQLCEPVGDGVPPCAMWVSSMKPDTNYSRIYKQHKTQMVWLDLWVTLQSVFIKAVPPVITNHKKFLSSRHTFDFYDIRWHNILWHFLLSDVRMS